jgi:CHAD domain-containing protein
MSLIDAIIAHVLKLEVELYDARGRLEDRSEPEALHELRIAVRRLRSLLNPLRGKDVVDALDRAAAAVGQLTTPIRDLEVLAEELRNRGLSEPASRREATLTAHYGEIVRSPVLQQLLVCLEAWPAALRAAKRDGELRRLDKLLSKRLRKQLVRLQDALADPPHDPHRIRLLVKRNRYAADAYPQHSPISAQAASVLKAVQADLGAWHDRYQWCLRASQEPDLEALRQQWQSEAATAMAQAEGLLLALAGLLASASKTRARGTAGGPL